MGAHELGRRRLPGDRRGKPGGRGGVIGRREISRRLKPDVLFECFVGFEPSFDPLNAAKSPAYALSFAAADASRRKSKPVNFE
jgi:hypothetical protein